jgi:hypothetical protein
MRKVTKGKSTFPTDDALLKMLYMATQDVLPKWTGRIHNWVACRELGITQRTLQRWRSNLSPTEDQRKHAKRPAPANKLSQEERQAILETANQPEYKSLPPSQIVPRLADQGIYLSISSLR